VVVWVLSNHRISRERWGVVDAITAILAATNLELLPLLPWEETVYEGLPSKTVATVPTVTLFAEDLPQLFIQGLYLVLSRDIGNYVVIASVGLSGCSLLLRFAKAAMHMLRRSGGPDSRLVETSPMRTWDDTKFSRWIQVKAAAARTEGSQELSKALDNLSAWTVSQLLHIVDAVNIEQIHLEDSESEDVGPVAIIPSESINGEGGSDAHRQSEEGGRKRPARDTKITSGDVADVASTGVWNLL